MKTIDDPLRGLMRSSHVVVFCVYKDSLGSHTHTCIYTLSGARLKSTVTSN